MEHLNEFKESLLEKQKTLSGNLVAADNNVVVAKQAYDSKIKYRDSIADDLEAINTQLEKVEAFEKWEKEQNKKKTSSKKTEVTDETPMT